MPVAQRLYGKLESGEEVTAYSLSNGNNVTVELISFGACISSVRTPDKSGDVADICLGFDNIEAWEKKNTCYLGCAIGRVGNRIKGGKFSVDGADYQLAQNNGEHALHGGLKGFDKRNWDSAADDSSVTFTLVSADGDQGYPGELLARVTYSLSEDNELTLAYGATTSKATPVNLTNHSYFNLGGAGSGTILDHIVESTCKQYTPVGADLIPTGELATVEGTPFDFSKAMAVGHRNADIDGGYDHNLVVNREGVADGALAPVFRVYHPDSGRSVECATTECGMQFYCGGFLDESVGREGKPYVRFGGFCMETQHFPDSINIPSFPTVLLKPGEEYSSTTVYTFSSA